MIGRLRGIILEKYPPLILLETGGVGYEIHMPMISFYRLPDVHKEAIIFTHFLIQKDKISLFGFGNNREKFLFQNLIKIKGIGPKLALEILSGMSIQKFINIIEQNDHSSLAKLHGIGKKTAERIIIDMKNRFKMLSSNFFDSIVDSKLISPNSLLMNDAQQEAVAALIALGYKSQEAYHMINKIGISNTNSETLIREALRLAL